MTDRALYGRYLADTYDTQYADLRDPSGDRAYYAALADEIGGPVLEIGCGTGRVLLPIAQRGHVAVGVDPSEEMLAVFRAKDRPETLTLVQSTAQEMDLDRRDFGLATFPFRAFMHLESPADQQAALQRVHAHLRPGGWLALDVFEPDLARIAEPHDEGDSPPFVWRDRKVIRRHTIVRDPTRQLMTLRFDYTDGETGAPLGTETTTMRWTYRFELEHLLARTGFEAFRWSSGYDGRPYVARGDIVVVARRV